ncbi:LON peptidase substrate-binding domain-containing protein [Zooshikella marina]|uniref:Peptidase S16 n=1 Tax=Zooshikella ganghwensis TaxID=202772 RepID=A0A4P9VTY8_9GAMM|nr:LON peptidase substrate-binding domain-containing protein [Zooshikella ganghwensis]MBU2706639.1 LON peptidase substrate-binding domain-containing protein [Zooshikella ganghwensis]RDH45914.1 peptidase S16 [Zooshikella ganghwensis]
MVNIPLFPLRAVLFPKCKMQLQIFEPRYLDMISYCMKHDQGFGVILVAEGSEFDVKHIEQVGTLAKIIDFFQLPNGLLGITITGEGKFAVLDHWKSEQGFLMSESQLLPEEPHISVPDEWFGLVDLLKALVQHPLLQDLELDVNYGDAMVVSNHLAAYMPFSEEKKQSMLEISNPLKRLEKLKGLLNDMQHSA